MKFFLIKKLFLLGILCFNSALTQNTTSTKPTTTTPKPICFKYCQCVSITLICSNFNSFNELDFNTNKSDIYFFTMTFNPKVKLNMDKNFNLTGLRIASSGTIEITNIKNFTLPYDPFEMLVYQGNKNFNLNYIFNFIYTMT